MTLELLVDFRDGNGETRRELLSVPESTKSVGDLKSLIEEEFSIPVCDQQLAYCGRCLSDNCSLSQLYFRHNDVLEVDYSTTVDVKEIKPLVDKLLQSSRRALSGSPQDFSGEFWPKETSVYSLCTLLERFSFDYFLGWKTLISSANRRYFTSLGGLGAVVSIYRAAVERRRFHQELDALHLPRGLKYSEHHVVLSTSCFVENSCLSMLWNFSETVQSRIQVLNYDILPLLFDSLLSSEQISQLKKAVVSGMKGGGAGDGPSAEEEVALPSSLTSSEDDESAAGEILEPDGLILDYIFDVSRSVVSSAIGCLVQYMEFDQVRVVTAVNENVIKKILHVSCGDEHDSYSRQVAANTLFCCSCSRFAQQAFVKRGIHETLKGMLMDITDVPTRYFLIGILANLRSAPDCLMMMEEAESVDCLMKQFAIDENLIEVASFEKDHSYVWITLLPFVQLAFAFGPGTDRQSGQAHPVDQLPHGCEAGGQTACGSPAVQRFGLCCIMQLCMRNENCAQIVKDGLFGYLQCLLWAIVEENHDLFDRFSQLLRDRFRNFHEARKTPSLRDIAVAHLAPSLGLLEALRVARCQSWLDNCLQSLPQTQ